MNVLTMDSARTSTLCATRTTMNTRVQIAESLRACGTQLGHGSRVRGVRDGHCRQQQQHALVPISCPRRTACFWHLKQWLWCTYVFCGCYMLRIMCVCGASF